ncbi:MAG: DUF4242 domain-containing protein [Saprospiraceae bacterium]|nr:DUF4242 domain-containing protein [Saprospiraceae bacterium]
MPIYMDLHKVPGIEAKHAAEAHRADLQIQEKFGCRCLTYWVDEERGCAFCLIDAPDEQSVIDMHNDAHGLIPHEIIQVNSNVVEAFLGRITDPEIDYESPESARSFCDPTFRVIVVCRCKDRVLSDQEYGPAKADKLFSLYFRLIRDNLEKYEGRQIEHRTDEFIISFVSAFQALRFTHQLSEQMHVAAELIELKIAVDAGLPVEKHKDLFGVTIGNALNMLHVGESNQIICGPVLRKIYKDDPPFLFGENQLRFLSQSDQESLNLLSKTLRGSFSDSNFGVADLSRQLATSKSGLYRTCIHLFNKPPGDLLKDYRLNRSIALLRAGYNVGEAAFASGFASTSYFSKTFTDHYGLQPSQYQKFYLEKLNQK